MALVLCLLLDILRRFLVLFFFFFVSVPVVFLLSMYVCSLMLVVPLAIHWC